MNKCALFRKMYHKRASKLCLILTIFLVHAVYADNYRFDLINSLVRNDLVTTENIINANITSMSASDKKLVMNFAINYSSGENTLKVCQLLLKYSIRPDSFDLFTAIDRNRQDSAIEFLLENGAAPNGEILLLALERQRKGLAIQFIEAGSDVNFQYPLEKNYADGMAPLLYAVKWGYDDIARLLIEKGADINIQAVNGDTALSIALKNNNDALYEYLLENGAAEPVAGAPPQNSGIADILDSGIYSFQRGSYRLSGSTRYMRFSGNASSGNIEYVDIANNRLNSGFYRITGNTISISLDGYSFVYRIDSNESFSGNGEIWVRIGN